MDCMVDERGKRGAKVDGAARVCDPFFDSINTGIHWCGKFLKDFKPIAWRSARSAPIRRRPTRR
jgi:hypothetical protein